MISKSAQQSLAEVGDTAGWPAAATSALRGETVDEATPVRVIVVRGGPYVVSGPVRIADHLGCPVEHDRVTALCRCGESATKPDCDAACVRTGFDDTKSPDRVPDRRDTYVGHQVTVYDNRGICQHSGLCTDRLSTVFHTESDSTTAEAGASAFVTPSGGRMDEIIRAVRDCPSGALSFGVDGDEARGQVDWGGQRAPSILITKDGPYRLTGGVEIVDGTGEPLPRAQGASAEHAALCRCGHSQNKPFCSGMHYYVDFRDPAPDSEAMPTVSEWAGGFPAFERMTRLFYEKHVPADDLLGPLFATMSADHPQRVAAWLTEVFGGPTSYSDSYGGYRRMLSEHIGKCLTEQQRARWVTLLMRAAAEAGLPNDAEFRSAFGSYIEWGSRLAWENSQAGAEPPRHMPMPSWGWHTAAGPPGGRISALSTSEPDVRKQVEQQVVLPTAGQPVGFDSHIKTLFRERDRRSMLFSFDLWKHADVATHAAAILARLRDGTMPCDGPWPDDYVAVFARWVDEGAAP